MGVKISVGQVARVSKLSSLGKAKWFWKGQQRSSNVQRTLFREIHLGDTTGEMVTQRGLFVISYTFLALLQIQNSLFSYSILSGISIMWYLSERYLLFCKQLSLSNWTFLKSCLMEKSNFSTKVSKGRILFLFRLFDAMYIDKAV